MADEYEYRPGWSRGYDNGDTERRSIGADYRRRTGGTERTSSLWNGFVKWLKVHAWSRGYQAQSPNRQGIMETSSEFRLLI